MEGEGEFVVEPPNLLECENARYTEKGAIAKRYGATAQTVSGKPTAGIDSNAIVDVEGALGLLHPDGFYQLDEYASAWRRTNECSPRPSIVKTDPLIRGNDNLKRADIAVSGDLVCVVWENGTTSTVFYAFLHRVTRAIIKGPTEIATNLIAQPRVIAFDEASGVVGTGDPRRFAIVGDNGTGAGGTLYVALYQVISGTYTFGAPVSLAVASATYGGWDVCRLADAARFCVMRHQGAATRFHGVDTAGSIAISADIAAFLGRSCVYNPVLGTVVALAVNGDIGNIAATLGGPGSSAALYTPTAPLQMERCTLVQKDSTGKMLGALSGRGTIVSNSATQNELGTDIIEISTTYTSVRSGFVPTLAIAAHGIYLNSLGIEDAALFLCEQVGPAGVQSPRAPVMLAVRTVVDAAGAFSAALWGRALQDRIDKFADRVGGGGGASFGHISRSVIVGSEVWNVATTRTDTRFIDPSSGVGSAKRDVDMARWTLSKAPASRSVTAQKTRLVGNGCGVTVLDAEKSAESTPSHINCISSNAAEDPVTETPTGGVGAIVIGYGAANAEQFRFQLVWRWIDSKGNIHRGPASVAVTFAANTTSYFDLTSLTDGARRITFPWALTSLNGDRATKLEVEVYLGDPANPTVMYRAGICKPKQDPTNDSLCYVAATWTNASIGSYPHAFNVLLRTTLEAQSQLYTGTELGAEPTPPCLDIVSTQKRVWALDAESRLDVWPSKPLVAGYAAEFNTALKIAIPHEGGEAVGLAAFGDRIAVFKERQIYAIYGDPGSAAGTGSTVQKPRLLFSDVGCVDRRSIVEGPFGVIFQSERGFYVLTPGESVEYVGEAVQKSIDGMTVTSAVLVPSESEVRFTIDSSAGTFSTARALVWNYRLNCWSVWTGFETVHACMWRGAYTRTKTQSRVIKETRGSWATDVTHALKIVTCWIKFDGKLSGFKRLKRIHLLGRYWTGDFRVSVEYDYAFTNGVALEVHDWTQAQLTDGRLVRSDEKVGTTVTTAYRLELGVKNAIQKIESVRLTLEERPLGADGIAGSNDDVAGRGFALNGVEFEVALKKGTHRYRIASGAKK